MRPTTSGGGGPAGSSREALDGAGDCAGDPEPPKADIDSVTIAMIATTQSSARRRKRRSRSTCRRLVARARRLGAGGDIRGKVPNAGSGFNARAPSVVKLQSQSGGRIRVTTAVRSLV